MRLALGAYDEGVIACGNIHMSKFSFRKENPRGILPRRKTRMFVLGYLSYYLNFLPLFLFIPVN